MITVSKLATWEHPVSGNIFKYDSPKFALAIICKRCLSEEKYPKFAVEWAGLGEKRDVEVIYHSLSELDDYIVGS